KYIHNKGPISHVTAISLSQMGYKKFDELIPSLVSALKNAEYYIVRMNAARQLFQNTEYLSSTLPHLIKALLNDSDFRLRQKIARYFGEINKPEVIEILKQATMNDSHPVVRTVAKTSLDDIAKNRN
ncbi:MAG: HEAT repeat domain-containing protein, partial [Asgard group archaeon]|nr:HEAT repeat domain-containing protein [Asgard group archaeon]